MTSKDHLTQGAEQAEKDRAVSDKVVAEWRAVRAFTPEKYVQESLLPDIAQVVRKDMAGQPSMTVDAEIAHRSEVEATAMEGLTAQELEVAARFHQRPSEYLAAKR